MDDHETEVPRHACAALRRGACDGGSVLSGAAALRPAVGFEFIGYLQSTQLEEGSLGAAPLGPVHLDL